MRLAPLVAPVMQSRPTRARGLKHEVASGSSSYNLSRPTRARGLKPNGYQPFYSSRAGRAPRGRVD